MNDGKYGGRNFLQIPFRMKMHRLERPEITYKIKKNLEYVWTCYVEVDKLKNKLQINKTNVELLRLPRNPSVGLQSRILDMEL